MRKILFTYIGLTLIFIQISAQINPEKREWMQRQDSLIRTSLDMKVDQDSVTSFVNDSLQSDSLEMAIDTLSLDTTAMVVDSATLKLKELRKKTWGYSWQIDERFGYRTEVPFDTLDMNFQNRELVEYKDVSVNFLGNAGTAAESRLFFNRKNESPFIFTYPYQMYMMEPGNYHFLNTKSPFTKLTYNRDLSTQEGEEHFNALFSVNMNKNTAFGFEYDLIYGRGYYNAQSTNHDQFALFGSHISDRYESHLYLGVRSFLNFENGGITDDRYITNPLEMSGGKREFEPRNIPVHMTDAWTEWKGFVGYYNHHYNLGFYKGEKTDSTSGDFVPITSLIHTIKFENYTRRYFSHTIPTDYYNNIYLDSLATDDSTKYHSIKNTLAVSLLEGFNKYSKFGLLGFIEHDIRQYRIMNDSLFRGNNLTSTTVGAELSKKKGELLTFDFRGELGIAGEEMGEFKLNGNISTSFRLWKDSVKLRANGSIKNLVPKFYYEQYYSNHFVWENFFKNEQRVHFGGVFSLPKRGTELKIDVENMTNHIYFDSFAMPSQYTSNIQVVAAQLNQNFKLGIFHLDNSVVYQKSSEESVLPLPELTLYHNLYLQGKVFNKVLTYQIGADVRYHTKYKATAYMPATGQFYVQDDMSVGGYPLVNAYANFHLKTVRFYVMAYHINSSMGSPQYFLQPHYPMNPFHVKFGLAWNFKD